MTLPNDSRGVETDQTRPNEVAYPDAIPAREHRASRQDLIAQEKAQYGGMKFGTAFFGWLATVGATVVLAAAVAAISAAVVGAGGTPVIVVPQPGAVTEIDGTAGLIGAIGLLAVVFVAYACGGYVAGRMARFSGAKQGLAVWLWALVITAVITVIGLAAGVGIDVPAVLESAPQFSLASGDLGIGTILTGIALIAVSLGGAVLGGIAGMRYHRKVDRVRSEV